MSEAVQPPTNPDLPASWEEKVRDDSIESLALIRKHSLERATLVADAVSNLSTFKVNSQADCDKHAQFLLDLKARKLRITAISAFIDKPIKTLSDAKGAGFAAQIARVDGIDAVIREELRAYRERLRVEAQRIDALNRQRAEFEAQQAREAAAAAQAEADRLAASAQQLADSGGSKLLAIQIGNASARAQEVAVQATENVRVALAVPSMVAAIPKTAGIATRADVEITLMDINEVPDSLCVITRTLDVRAVKRFIKDSNGSAVIPGLRWKAVENLIV